MSEVNEYAPGTFSWVDLATTDARAARQFYTGLFEWSFEDLPMGEGNFYTMLKHKGKEVAALYEQVPEQRSQGVPPHWLSYVTVSDADESANKAKALGGNVLMEPFDVMESGRMALVQDPTGATFAMWQPRTHIGAQLVNEPCSLCWNELATNDTAKAGAFYTGLFGWGTQVQDTGQMVYTTFTNNDQPGAGMMPIAQEWGDIPPHWMVYFAVEDCEAAVQKAQSLGGQVVVPPTDAADVGRFAIIQDPQGAMFSVIKLNEPA